MTKFRKTIRFAYLPAVFCLAVLPSTLALLQDASTPFDEAAHVDYVLSVRARKFPTVNGPYRDETLNLVICNLPPGDPMNFIWTGAGECGGKSFEPSNSPFGGQSYLLEYAPTFYLYTAFLSSVCTRVMAAQGIHNAGLELKCMRFPSILLLGFSSVLIAAVLKSVGMRRMHSSAAAIVPSLPLAISIEAATVNNDNWVPFALTSTLSLLYFVYRRLTLNHLKFRWTHALVLGTVLGILMSGKETALVSLAPFAAILFALGFFGVPGFANRLRESIRYSTVPFLTFLVSFITAFVFLRFGLRSLRGQVNPDLLMIWYSSSRPPSTEILLDAFKIGLSPFGLVPWNGATNWVGRLQTTLLEFLVFSAVGVALFVLGRQSTPITNMPSSLESEKALPPQSLEGNRLMQPNRGNLLYVASPVLLLAMPLVSLTFAILIDFAVGDPFAQHRYFMHGAALAASGTVAILLTSGDRIIRHCTLVSIVALLILSCLSIVT